jgi:hypothetical protein
VTEQRRGRALAVVDSGGRVRHIGAMSAAAQRPRGARYRLAAGGVGVAVSAIVVSGALAAASKTLVITDPHGDVTGALDLTRVSLQRSSDGRLRAVLSFADKVTPKTLLAGTGPPGSACMRIWTAADADPTSMRPDRLACVTARSEDEFRGGVYDATGPQPPKRLADASVKQTASGQSIVLRFTQSSIGRPPRIRFAIEATRPGCERVTCIDTLPDRGAARTFRLR